MLFIDWHTEQMRENDRHGPYTMADLQKAWFDSRRYIEKDDKEKENKRIKDYKEWLSD